MSFFGNGHKLKETLVQLLWPSAIILLFLPLHIQTGNHLVDLLLIQIGLRLIGVSIIVGEIIWFLKHRGPGDVSGGLGGMMVIYGVWGGVRFFIAWLDPEYSRGAIYGVDLDVWWTILLMGLLHIILIVGGLLLLSRAQRIAREREGDES